MNKSLINIKALSCDDSFLKNSSKRLVVWWYGSVIKNRLAKSVPKTIVLFRQLTKSNEFGSFVSKAMALTHLGLLRIGSVWKNGTSDALIDWPEREFDISFCESDWKIISCCEGHTNLIPNTIYPLGYTFGKSYLLDFSLQNDGHLLIPCMEFFVRCYGRSAEVKRIISTYPWEEAQKRLFIPVDLPVSPGTWPIKLTERVYRDDVVFLSHVLYDPYTQQAVKTIYAQIEAGFQDTKSQVFLKVSPWFQGKAQLLVAGVEINDRTFLGLRILGCSDPQGNSILHIRGNTNKDNQMNENNGILEESGFPVKRLAQLPSTADLTDDAEPDHGEASLGIREEKFRILGTPRSVINISREGLGNKAAGVHSSSNISIFSTGNPYSSAKGVGYASIYAPTVFESEGILNDVWNALLRLQENHPNTIQEVKWFTFQDGFNSEPKPRFIALQPFDENEKEIKPSVRKWVYYNVDKLIPRGILVVKVVVSKQIIYLLEIQRRLAEKHDRNKTEIEEKEAYQGLIFKLNDQKDFLGYLRKLLAQIRYVKGIVQRLNVKCPGVVYTYKHSSSRSESVPHETSVRNAFSKVGVKI